MTTLLNNSIDTACEAKVFLFNEPDTFVHYLGPLFISTCSCNTKT